MCAIGWIFHNNVFRYQQPGTDGSVPSVRSDRQPGGAEHSAEIIRSCCSITMGPRELQYTRKDKSSSFLLRFSFICLTLICIHDCEWTVWYKFAICNILIAQSVSGWIIFKDVFSGHDLIQWLVLLPHSNRVVGGWITVSSCNYLLCLISISFKDIPLYMLNLNLKTCSILYIQ